MLTLLRVVYYVYLLLLVVVLLYFFGDSVLCLLRVKTFKLCHEILAVCFDSELEYREIATMSMRLKPSTYLRVDLLRITTLFVGVSITVYLLYCFYIHSVSPKVTAVVNVSQTLSTWQRRTSMAASLASVWVLPWTAVAATGTELK